VLPIDTVLPSSLDFTFQSGPAALCAAAARVCAGSSAKHRCLRAHFPPRSGSPAASGPAPRLAARLSVRDVPPRPQPRACSG